MEIRFRSCQLPENMRGRCRYPEGLHDLIRWGVLGKALKLFGEISSVNQKENKPYPAYRNFTEGKHELFPIPLKEIQSNPKLNGMNNNGY